MASHCGGLVGSLAKVKTNFDFGGWVISGGEAVGTGEREIALGQVVVVGGGVGGSS